jgi:hypothetical protein
VSDRRTRPLHLQRVLSEAWPVNCPRCGAENQDEAEFCSLCAQQFSKDPSAGDTGASIGPHQFSERAQAYRPPSQPDFTLAPAPGHGSPNAHPAGPPAPSARSDRRFPFKAVIAVVVVIVLLMGFAWIVKDHFSTEKTFSSKKTTLKFDCPRSWKETSPAWTGLVSGLDLRALTDYSEAVLVDNTTFGQAREMFVVSGSAIAYPGDWDRFKSTIKDLFTSPTNSTMAGLSASGATMTTPVFAETKVGKDKGVSINYHISKEEKVVAVEQVVLPHEQDTYIFELVTPYLKTSSKQMKDIMDTVRF